MVKGLVKGGRDLWVSPSQKRTAEEKNRLIPTGPYYVGQIQSFRLAKTDAVHNHLSAVRTAAGRAAYQPPPRRADKKCDITPRHAAASSKTICDLFAGVSRECLF